MQKVKVHALGKIYYFFKNIDWICRMNERIANQYNVTLKELKKHQKVDVADLPIPPDFEPLKPSFIAEAQQMSVIPSQKKSDVSALPKQKTGIFYFYIYPTF